MNPVHSSRVWRQAGPTNTSMLTCEMSVIIVKMQNRHEVVEPAWPGFLITKAASYSAKLSTIITRIHSQFSKQISVSMCITHDVSRTYQCTSFSNVILLAMVFTHSNESRNFRPSSVVQ